MRKYLVLLATAMIFTSCGEYQRVLKSNDANYRLDYAKRAFEAKNTLRHQLRLKTSSLSSKVLKRLKTLSTFLPSQTMRTKTTRLQGNTSRHITAVSRKVNIQN